ncbi:predicted protein [Histoplasma capsulatum var. duboisii H88]|uniref:Predicted protein n=1 Tax=Ajellomyces capsulatus (strain H88) TaxID=544711 RepID=F0UC59_AJEC8|nr:predicted protein [Histoplasma capsulatum var. duboisii H88]
MMCDNNERSADTGVEGNGNRGERHTINRPWAAIVQNKKTEGKRERVERGEKWLRSRAVDEAVGSVRLGGWFIEKQICTTVGGSQRPDDWYIHPPTQGSQKSYGMLTLCANTTHLAANYHYLVLVYLELYPSKAILKREAKAAAQPSARLEYFA